MRSDYPLYVLAAICLVVAIYAYATPSTGIHGLSLYALAVLGIVFFGLGYVSRPKSKTLSSSIMPAIPKPAPKPETQPATETKEEPKETPTKKRAQKRKTSRRKKAT